MDKFLEVLKNPTVRRLVVFLLGLGCTVLHKKLGLDLDPNDILATVVLTLGYVGQSAYTDASKTRSQALVEQAVVVKATPPPVPLSPAP